MIGLAIIGLLVIGFIVFYGVWIILNRVTFTKTTERYRYLNTKDENGNNIIKVVDLEDQKHEN